MSSFPIFTVQAFLFLSLLFACLHLHFSCLCSHKGHDFQILHFLSFLPFIARSPSLPVPSDIFLSLLSLSRPLLLSYSCGISSLSLSFLYLPNPSLSTFVHRYLCSLALFPSVYLLFLFLPNFLFYLLPFSVPLSLLLFLHFPPSLFFS